MEVGPPPGDSSPAFSDEEVTDWLIMVFSQEARVENALDRAKLATAFANLTGVFALEFSPQLLGSIRFDQIGLQAMFRRFQRDAFGVARFHESLAEMVDANELSTQTRREIIRKADGLGIRINTPSPRKTRIAAAFSLWMCTFRPVQICNPTVEGVDLRFLETFCASLNFWMACSFLTLFGDVNIGNGDDAEVRRGRVRHDFTYRAVNLSSLEMLYASIFRLRPAE